MSDKPVYLTAEGKVNLEKELEQLITYDRREVADRINAAKELGDISESGEYEEAKKAQSLLEGRIREIKAMLSRAQIILHDSSKNGNNAEVQLGSSVSVKFDGDDEEETWTIVGSAEASPRHGRISNESPIGSAILGKRVKDTVVFDTPNGPQKITITRID